MKSFTRTAEACGKACHGGEDEEDAEQVGRGELQTKEHVRPQRAEDDRHLLFDGGPCANGSQAHAPRVTHTVSEKLRRMLSATLIARPEMSRGGPG